MSEAEFRERQNARGAGAAAGLGVFAVYFGGKHAVPMLTSFAAQAYYRFIQIRRAQATAMNRIDNIIKNNAKPHDFEVVRKELSGIDTGFDHVTEMRNSLRGLRDSVKTIQGSLNNSNLTRAQRSTLNRYIKKAKENISRMEETLRGPSK